MPRTKFDLIKLAIFLLLLFWYSLFFAHKIDLTTADLGRHIQNGNVLLNGNTQEKQAVLRTNFYSYTLPQREFINHHWFSGVVFYLVHQSAGFGGVSFLYVLFALGSIVLYFDVARRKSNFWLSVALSLVVLPLIVKRVEVRPEVFSYFLTGVFLWILTRGKTTNKIYKLIWVLPLLMLIWVNLHIGFVFGFLVLGAFGMEELILFLRKKPNSFLRLLKLSGACLIAACINPFFLKGLIYPLQIFSNYGYLVVENQSIGFLENLKFVNGQHFILFRILTLALLASIVGMGFRNWQRIDIPLTILAVVSGVLAYKSIRNFPVFAYFAIPTISYQLHLLNSKLESTTKQIFWTFGLIAIIFALFLQNQERIAQAGVLGFGLMPEVDKSAEFVKRNEIKGPIFNNYDIGGYLIYHLYPEKVFVDNRPEAYTEEFFKNVYIATQEDSRKFQELDAKFRFNSIMFSHRDYTPWGQAFLVARVKDRAWAPVFVDNYNIIFLKRNEINVDLIKKYELPPDKFSVKAN